MLATKLYASRGDVQEFPRRGTMEGSQVGTMGANAEGNRANGFPHSPQRLGACGEDAGADARSGTVRARLIGGTVEVLADASDASDPRLSETGVTRTTA
jgi:hypothetical protein